MDLADEEYGWCSFSCLCTRMLQNKLNSLKKSWDTIQMLCGVRISLKINEINHMSLMGFKHLILLKRHTWFLSLIEVLHISFVGLFFSKTGCGDRSIDANKVYKSKLSDFNFGTAAVQRVKTSLYYIESYLRISLRSPKPCLQSSLNGALFGGQMRALWSFYGHNMIPGPVVCFVVNIILACIFLQPSFIIPIQQIYK